MISYKTKDGPCFCTGKISPILLYIEGFRLQMTELMNDKENEGSNRDEIHQGTQVHKGVRISSWDLRNAYWVVWFGKSRLKTFLEPFRIQLEIPDCLCFGSKETVDAWISSTWIFQAIFPIMWRRVTGLSERFVRVVFEDLLLLHH